MQKTGAKDDYQRVEMRLPGDLVKRFRAMAKREGLTMPGLQILVMTKMLDGDDAVVGLSDRSDASSNRGVHLRLRNDEIAAVREAARSHGHSLSGWVAMAVREKLKGTAGAGIGLVAQREQSEKATKQALSLRLRVDEIAAVREAAAVDGYSLSGWVAMLVRAKLRQTPMLTGDEVSGLLKAAGQLMAVGRNINAAVRKLHAEGKWTQQNQPMLAALAAVEDVKGRVKALLEAAERRGAF